MTRCVCCDRNLSDFESTIRLRSTGEFADTCQTCIKEIGPDVEYIYRNDVQDAGDEESEDEDYGDEDESV